MSEHSRQSPVAFLILRSFPPGLVYHLCQLLWNMILSFRCFSVRPTFSSILSCIKKAVMVLFIWINALFSFLILQRLPARASVSVSFLHWLHTDFVLDLKCTLSSLPRCVCCSCYFCIMESLEKECFTTLTLTLWGMVQKTLTLQHFFQA